jgi:VIT1/CCC1 family predicted Fe2+/Mn2+ transporter
MRYTPAMHDIAHGAHPHPHSHAPQQLHIEGHFESSEAVRDVVIGLSDGLTVPFALAAGLSGAVSSAHIIVLAGLAEIAAGSIAMGLGGYLAARGDAEHYASELKREQTEVITRPDDEAEEIYQIFDQYLVPREAATPVLAALQKNHPAYVDFMMRFELGLEKPAPNRAHRSALTIAVSYICGGLVPLLPYMFVGSGFTRTYSDGRTVYFPLVTSTSVALKLSVLITLIALALFGALKGRLVDTGALRSALQTSLIGGAAAAAAYTLAHLLNRG